MKTLIIYSTTYGYTKECAEELSKKIIGSDIVDLKSIKDAKALLQAYDTIIIGSSIYMGQISKVLNQFLKENIELLKTKKIALFLCCGLAEKYEETMNTVFSKELIDIAIAKEFFGGVLNIEKMKFIHKIIAKLMKKVIEKEGLSEVKPIDENIDKLVEKLKYK